MIYRYAIPFPIASGKTETDAASIAAFFKTHSDQYQESRGRLGTTVERTYLQNTPMGTIVNAYVEGTQDFGDWLQGLVSSDLEIDKKFIAMVADVHGVGVAKLLDGPAPETIGEWSDPQVSTRKQGLAFVAPILPGQESAARAFAREAFVTRQAELTESRKALGLCAEVVTLSITPMGSLICVYFEGNDPVEANRRFAASTTPYDLWFKGQLKSIVTPDVDLSQPLSPIKELFSFVAEHELVHA